jgi:hypothetical protein
VKPNYQLRCALRCTDRFRRPRYGSQWVHIHGQTSWVCEPCAEFLGAAVGIPTSRQQRHQVQVREGRLQLPLDAVLLEDQVVADGLP